jgi:NtrC-family two-component system sensor histidine kinase KinB
MSLRRRHAFSILVGLLLFGGLAYVGWNRPHPAVDPLAWLLFTGLFLFMDVFSFPVDVAYVNLAATSAMGALLVLGPLAAAWIALTGALVNVVLRWAFPTPVRETEEPGGLLSMAGIGLLNATLLTLSLLGGAALYAAAGGPLPLTKLGPPAIGPFLLLLLGFNLINYLLAAGYLLLPGDWAALNALRRALPKLLLYEVLPQVFTPLLPLIYTGFGPGPFLLFAVGVGGASLVTRRLAQTGQRLERRVTELNTLSALSQALAASLQIDDLLATLAAELPKILPVGGLYVALWHPQTDEVSFPLAVEKGRRLSWDMRRQVNGLSEYVMRTHQPLLLPDNVTARVTELGLTPPATPAAGWLVVPIIAGSQVLGALGVYALDPQAPRLNEADRDLLLTIATPLALALHNASVYVQTDEALAQRVQQLSSILYTTSEGILLLDAETRVLTANRALESFAGLPATELSGRALATDDALLARLGTNSANLQADLAALQNGSDLVTHFHTTGQTPQREVERTLAPVRAGSGAVAGWLLILRDVTEEQDLGRLRDDLTHMLIHDLRGPLGSILTGLALIQQMTPPGRPLEPEALEVLKLARKSGQNLLHMINQLLDVARIESGTVPLERERVSPEELLSAAVERLRPAAEAAAIQLVAEAAPGLPELSVDTQLLGRVLDNLGDNAVKFAPDGSTVRLWTRPTTTPPGVLFGVSDQGPGIPAADQIHLFEKFNRLPNILGRRTGTGLGLAFCRLVVVAHGGEITVDSAPGKGSTFVVRLPVTKDSSTDRTDETNNAKRMEPTDLK